MKMLEAVEPDSLPFEHESQSQRGQVIKALTNLKGRVLPIKPEEGETPHTMRNVIYQAATKAGLTIGTQTHDEILYVWVKNGRTGS